MSGNGHVAAAGFGIVVSQPPLEIRYPRADRAPTPIALYRRAAVLGVIELVGCVLAGLGTFSRMSALSLSERYVWPEVFGFAGAWVVLALVLGLYSRQRLLAGVRNNLQRGLLAGALALGLLLLLAVASQSAVPVSRAWFINWMFWVLLVITATRWGWVLILDRALSRGACIERAVVVAETDETAAELSEAVRRESDGRIGVVLSVAVPEANGGPVMKQIDEVIRNGLCERIIFGDCERKLRSFQSLMDRLSLVAVDVTIISRVAGGLVGPVTSVDRIGSLPTVSLATLPLTPVQAFLKRTEDVIVASLTLVLLAPVLAVIAIGVKLDSRGPVLFSQPREGYNGRVFHLLKFRTMHVDLADRVGMQTSRNDPRVTWFGGILRRMSLDELPQLINVVRGEMSVVGPRPHAVGMTTLGTPLRELLVTYDARHRLRPGITGWAQVRNCRGEIHTVEKLRRRVFLDCDYISRWSLALDFWIILKTTLLVFNDRDAY